MWTIGSEKEKVRGAGTPRRRQEQRATSSSSARAAPAAAERLVRGSSSAAALPRAVQSKEGTTRPHSRTWPIDRSLFIQSSLPCSYGCVVVAASSEVSYQIRAQRHHRLHTMPPSHTPHHTTSKASAAMSGGPAWAAYGLRGIRLSPASFSCTCDGLCDGGCSVWSL